MRGVGSCCGCTPANVSTDRRVILIRSAAFLVNNDTPRKGIHNSRVRSASAREGCNKSQQNRLEFCPGTGSGARRRWRGKSREERAVAELDGSLEHDVEGVRGPGLSTSTQGEERNNQKEAGRRENLHRSCGGRVRGMKPPRLKRLKERGGRREE